MREPSDNEGRVDAVGIDGLADRDRRRLRRTWLAVTAPVALVYTWVLTGHTWGLLGGQYFADFYDAQARSLLDGRWDVPPEVAGFEGFAVDGRTHIYFGPLPALLRMPLFVLTDRFDGRLTIVSMLAGFLLFAWAAFRLSVALRAFVRGEAPVTRRERAGTALLAVAVLAGTPFWLSSQTVVHHEAVLWGVATTVAAFDACARWVLDPRGTRLAVASGWVAAAMLTRQTLGLGALAALGMLVAAQLLVRARARLALTSDAGTLGSVAGGPGADDQLADGPGAEAEPDGDEDGTVTSVSRGPGASEGGGRAAGAGAAVLRRWARRAVGGRPGRVPRGNGAPGAGLPVWGLVAALLVPAVLSAIPNLARFDKVFGVPVESQVFTTASAHRQEFLEANRGSFFGVQFVPTTLLQYFRPDAFDIRPDLPWIDFPRTRPKVIGGATFDDVTFASSITVTMPLLVLLAAVGVAVLVRAARRRRPEAWVGVLAVGAVVGAGGVLTIGHVAHRYLNDVFPMVLIPALVGFHALAPRLDGWTARRRRLATAAAVGAVTFGALATLAMTLQYRHERGPGVVESERAEWVRARATMPLSSPNVVEIDEDQALPDPAFDGLLAVVGDCDGVYVRVDDLWFPVERGPETNVYDVTVDLDALGDLDDGQRRAPLVTIGSGYDAMIIAVAPVGDGEVRVDVWDGGDRGWRLGNRTAVSGTVTLEVVADTRSAPNAVSHGDDVLHGQHISPRSTDSYRIGAAPTIPGLAPAYPGPIALEPADHSICEALTD